MTPRDYRSEVLFVTACIEAFGGKMTLGHLRDAVARPSTKQVWLDALRRLLNLRRRQSFGMNYPTYLMFTDGTWSLI